MGNPKPKSKQPARNVVAAKRFPKRDGANIGCGFDTETTGLIENRTVKDKWLPEVIDFYAVVFDMDTGEVLDELDLFIKPSREIGQDITDITHITNEMVADAPSFKEVAADIKSILESSKLVIGHNISFDKEMIDIEMARIGMNVNWPRTMCTVEQTIHLKGFRLNLTSLHEHLFGEPFPDAHRAYVDAQAMAKCVIELRKRGEL